MITKTVGRKKVVFMEWNDKQTSKQQFYDVKMMTAHSNWLLHLFIERCKGYNERHNNTIENNIIALVSFKTKDPNVKTSNDLLSVIDKEIFRNPRN